MLMEMVPDVPNVTVVNKKIFYDDNQVPTNENLNSLQVYSVNNVSKYSLDACLRKILESNPDAVINAIKYSIEDETVYFYTETPISTIVWTERKGKEKRVIRINKDVLTEINDILGKDLNKDSDCISLYDIVQLTKEYATAYNSIEEKYEEYLNKKIKEQKSKIDIYSFDSEKKQLQIGYNKWPSLNSSSDRIFLEKKDEDLYVVKSESNYYQEVLELLGQDLSELFDKIMKFNDFKNQKSINVSLFNTNLHGSISSEGVKIISDLPNGGFIKKFELSSSSTKINYDYICNSTILLSALKGKEDEIFKRIFVRIDDCPEWSRDELYKTRQQQLSEEREKEKARLAEEKRIEEERLEQEREEQKKLAFRRKFFFWLDN